MRGIPTTFDEIITSNRDRFAVERPTGAELATITDLVDNTAKPRGRIDDWELLALRDKVLRSATLHVVGELGDEIWMTSQVAMLAPDRSRCQTRNSLYLLGVAASNEPDIHRVLHVARVLRAWGVDRRYELGIVEVV